MKGLRLFSIIVGILCLGAAAHGAMPTADELVRKSDTHRLMGNNFEMTIKLNAYLNNRVENSTTMKGFVSNGKLLLLTFEEPANMKGRKVIFKEDNDLRLVVPTAKKPLRITAAQILMGGISYGEIAAVSYAEDYTAQLTGDAAVNGINTAGDKTATATGCWVLELSARNARVKYQKILLWVDKQNSLPVKADFFARSGKRMASAYYAGFKEWNGKLMITKTFLFDQISTAKYCTMEYSEIKTTAPQTLDELLTR